MRAARLHRYGPADVLQIDEIPDPVAGPGEVLIAVGASSVNPVDAKLRRGVLRLVMWWTLPHTTGLDCAGTVLAVGTGVTRFAVGDRVYGSPNPKHQGVCSEKAVLKASELAHTPTSLTDLEAASLPLAGLTAWQCLVDAAKVQPGEKVLILGGAGGVGSLAIQIAKALGAEVAATASPRNHALMERLGVDHIVDYTKDDPADALPPQDVVLITVSGDGGATAIRASRRGARLTHIVGDLATHVARHGQWVGTLVAGWHMAGFWVGSRLRGRRGMNIVMRPDGESLARITALVDAGSVEPVVDTVFAFDDIADSHRAVEAGKTQGKVVIQIGA